MSLTCADSHFFLSVMCMTTLSGATLLASQSCFASNFELFVKLVFPTPECLTLGLLCIVSSSVDDHAVRYLFKECPTHSIGFESGERASQSIISKYMCHDYGTSVSL